MKTAVSADGTKIAFDQTGDGPPVILVLGAFNERPTSAPLAKALESDFTVFNYDRRGRGASGDTQPYEVEREVDDLEALISAAGEAARVFGYSSGAILALEAAAHGLNITQLALYDAPIMVGDERPRPPKDMAARLAKLVVAGRRGEAVELFQTRMVGISAGPAGSATCDRAGLARRERFGQGFVKHLRAGLGLIAERGRHLRADDAGVGLARTEPAQIRHRRRSCRDGVRSANVTHRGTARGRTAGQEHQHHAEPECHSQQKEHKSRIPGGLRGRTCTQPSRQR